MRFAINVQLDDAPDELEDDIRDALASLVENALALTPYNVHVGTVSLD